MKRRLQRRLDRGVTTLEFALLTPFIVILLLGTIDISMATMIDSALEHGAEAATRIGTTVSLPDDTSRAQAIRDAVWYWLDPWLTDQKQLSITSQTYPAYSSIGQPEPCLDDSYKNTGTCTGDFTDVNDNHVWDKDMGKDGAGGYGAIVRYQITVTLPTSYTGFLTLLKLDPLFPLQRTIVVQNEQ